jgi:pilus assembly protein CpaB
MRIILVILAALIVAGGTGFYVVQGLRPPAQEVTQIEAPELREVFVAARELPSGTILTPALLSRIEMTEAAITPQMISADADGQAAVMGSVARQVLPEGVPLARTAIVQPGDRGFLAAVLPKGMRAITIAISEVAGIGGLVLPGDRVDIILTYSVAGSIIDAERDIRASETVLTNIRVLALDQRLGPVVLNEEGEAETPPIATTATLEVTPQQAEIVTLSQTLGDLSLILNSVRDGGEPDRPKTELVAVAAPGPDGAAAAADPRPMTLDSEVTSLLRRELKQNEMPLSRIQVVRGAAARAIRLGAEDDIPAQASAPDAEPAPQTE